MNVPDGFSFYGGRVTMAVEMVYDLRLHFSPSFGGCPGRPQYFTPRYW